MVTGKSRTLIYLGLAQVVRMNRVMHAHCTWRLRMYLMYRVGSRVWA